MCDVRCEVCGVQGNACACGSNLIATCNTAMASVTSPAAHSAGVLSNKSDGGHLGYDEKLSPCARFE